MRHGKRNQRLSKPTDQREALIHGMMQGLIIHRRVKTTYARAKEAQRLADRLVTWGKEGSVHSRRLAFRILQNRTLVKHLFADIAPVFVDVQGGYTRVTRLNFRRGDGAQEAVLTFSLDAALHQTAPAPKTSAAAVVAPAAGQAPASPAEQETEKPKGFLEGLRGLWTRKKKGL
ncbi:MAG: 50S ribosomal protein L17 [Candidatus Omnitrophica bacterium]|nr:50S ribosomal protein L17 [Candidatus Omnitrophota bacterium]